MPSTTSGPGAGTSPTWYDVLGVDRHASAATIKQAWRDATDKFEPGSGAGQFRMFNDAADVLLDPERRAEYDATLLPSDPEPGPEPEPDPEPTQGSDAATGPREPVAPAATPPTGRPRGVVGLLTLVAGNVVLLGLLVLLTVGVVVGSAVAGVSVQRTAVAQDARAEAPAAAERAASAMLSYDYRQLPEDRQRASRYLTGGFKKQYLQNFELLEEQKDGTPGPAVQSKAVVKATVQGSGVVDVSGSGRTARVLVFVDQVSEKEGADPQIFQNRVQMTMQDVGGRWLVSNLRSY